MDTEQAGLGRIGFVIRCRAGFDRGRAPGSTLGALPGAAVYDTRSKALRRLAELAEHGDTCGYDPLVYGSGQILPAEEITEPGQVWFEPVELPEGALYVEDVTKLSYFRPFIPFNQRLVRRVETPLRRTVRLL